MQTASVNLDRYVALCELPDTELNLEVIRTISFIAYIRCRGEPPDYCREWELTGPLLAKYGIALIPSGNEWCAYIGSYPPVYQKSPLRAVLIAFLLHLN